MLKRLLFSHQRPSQLLVAVFGALIGLLLMLAAVQLYFDFDAVLNGSSDLNKPQYLVINKEVNLLNTLFGGQKGFSPEEIEKLKEVKGVRNAAGLTASEFKVSVSMGQGGIQGMPGMSTDLFFEAVPDNFIDVDANAFQWHEGDSLVPIILPRDYIKLYNFGFARTQGLPQVTESVVGLARFNINIHGRQENAVFKGKLAGFSERINTILVPESFVDYANQKFGGVKPGSRVPSRVIIECDGPATAEISEYFTTNGYETSEEALRNSKLNSYLRIIMNIIVVIGLIIVILAANSFLLYSQLVISKSTYELETLIRIGYDYKQLGRIYLKYYAMIYAGIYIFCIPALFIAKGWFSSYMKTKGFDLPSGLTLTVLLLGFGFCLLFLLLNARSLFSELKKLAR